MIDYYWYRLSEAHAKVMMRKVVQVEDAVVAIVCISLTQLSAQTSLLGEWKCNCFATVLF